MEKTKKQEKEDAKKSEKKKERMRMGGRTSETTKNLTTQIFQNFTPYSQLSNDPHSSINFHLLLEAVFQPFHAHDEYQRFSVSICEGEPLSDRNVLKYGSIDVLNYIHHK